jgi:hypothetical protein
VGLAQNRAKQIIGWNIEFTMKTWNEAKFTYKEWPIREVGG